MRYVCEISVCEISACEISVCEIHLCGISVCECVCVTSGRRREGRKEAGGVQEKQEPHT